MKRLFLSGLLLGHLTIVSAFSSSQEAFLVEDERYLGQVFGRFSCDDDAFEKIFPPCTSDDVNPSVDRIITTKDIRGTGTIVETDAKTATGIRAKHVLFDYGKPLFGKLYLGSMKFPPGKGFGAP
jgi:hypothetical protein